MATVPADGPAPRIVTLDIVRGVAVMGILAMNIVAFAMPPQAYINPLAYGAQSAIDFAVYAFNFVLIDGKMRGLFSFLFGASMLLVSQQAEARDDDPGPIVLRRQLWLLLFGMIHYYLIWYGDILIGYALIGLVAWQCRNRDATSLVGAGITLVTIQLFVMIAMAAYAHSLAAAISSPSPTPDKIAEWQSLASEIAVPSPNELKQIMALYLGPWSGIVHEQVTDKLWTPVIFSLFFGWETLAYMLFGMAALKTGFLTGTWDESSYRRVAAFCPLAGIVAYLVLAWLIFADNFSVPGLFAWSFAATVPFRPVMVVGYAALIILFTRRGGWLVQRIAAAGRAAFTNYLGTSLLMTGVFYGWGLGLFGSLTRAELWLVVLAVWLLMLAWSKPWLDRFNYGPFEWLWRSLARWQLQPMRRRS